MAKTVTIRLDDETYRKFVNWAERDARPLGKYIEKAALEYGQQAEFADDEEMNDIRRNEGLLRRIKQGFADAKARRGKIVDEE